MPKLGAAVLSVPPIQTPSPDNRQSAFGDRWFVPGCLLAAVLVVGLVYGRALNYPFIQDDWSHLSALVNQSGGERLANEFSPSGKLHYRPLAAPVFLLFYRLFGLDPQPIHLLNLLLLAASALLVAALARRLGFSRGGALTALIVYAAAVSVHLDPVLWMVGFYDLAGALFFLLGLYLFLGGRLWASLAVLAAGLLVKESLVVLPAIFVLSALREDKPLKASFPAALRRAAPHLLLVGGYLALRTTTGLSPFGLPGDHPYAALPLGLHLVKNFVRYVGWSVEALTPFRELGLTAALLLAAGLVGGWIWARWRRPGADGGAADGRRVLFLAGWWGLALLPVVFLPNHAYKYYLVYGLPALAMLFADGLTRTVRSPGRTRNVRRALAGVYLALLVATAALSFAQADDQGLAAPFVPGANHLVHRAHAVAIVQDHLSRTRPKIPRGAVFVIGGMDIESFDRDWMFRTLYRDLSIQAFRTEEVKTGPRGEVAQGPGNAIPIQLEPARTIRLTVRKSPAKGR